MEITLETVQQMLTEREDKLVSGRRIHEALGVETHYNDWIKRMLKYGFEEGTDFTTAQKRVVVNNGGHKDVTEYYMTSDMAKEICMIQRSEIGRQIRKYFIEVEKLASPEMKQRALDILLLRHKTTLKQQAKEILMLKAENEALDRENDKLVEALSVKTMARSYWYYH